MQKQVDDASPTLYRYLLDTEVAAYRDGVCHELRALYRQHAFCAIELGGTPYSVIRNQRGDTCQLLDSHGICTDPETCHSWAQAISRQLDGARVRWICDPTVNPGWDLLKAVIEKSPILTKASKEIAMVVKHEYTQLRQTTPQPKQWDISC